MECINLNIPHFKMFVFHFGEIALSQALEKLPKEGIPSLEDILRVSKKELGILPKSEVRKQLGITIPTNASTRDLQKLHKRIGEVNNDLFSRGVELKYRTVFVRKQGQSDAHFWDVQRMEKKLNMLSKIERVQDKIVDPQDNISKLDKLKELQKKDDEDPQGKLFAINPNEEYSSITVSSSFKDKQELLKTFKIKRSRSHYFYTLTSEEQVRVNSYLKKSSALGSTKLGFTLSDDSRGIVSYKQVNNKGYLYIDIKDVVDINGMKMRKIIGRVKIPVDLVYHGEESTYIKSELEGVLYIPELQRLINQDLFKVKGISAKKSANFYLLQVKSLLIRAIKDISKEEITYEDLNNLSEEEYKSLYDRIGVKEAIQRIAQGIKDRLAGVDDNELRAEIVDLYEGHFGTSIGDFSKLVDTLPIEFLKLITFKVVDMDNAYFSQNSQKNKKSVDELQNLAKLDGMQIGLALNVALRRMYDEKLITKERLDKANEILKPQVAEYVNLKKQLKLKDDDARELKKSLVKKRKALLSSFDSYLRKNMDLLDNELTIFINNFETYWREAAKDIQNISIEKNKGLTNLITEITASVGTLNSVFTEVALGQVSQVGKTMKVDDVTIAMHELGHALDLYLISTNNDLREKILKFIETLINQEGFKTYIETGFHSRGYDLSNKKELTADLYAWILGKAIGYDMSKGHLADLDEYFKNEKHVVDMIYNSIFDNEKEIQIPIEDKGIQIVSDESHIVRLFKDILNAIINKINDVFKSKIFNTLPYYAKEISTTSTSVESHIDFGDFFEHLRGILFDSTNFDIDKILASETQELFRGFAVQSSEYDDGTMIKECK